MARKHENFYKRDPAKAMQGMMGLSLEERGAFNTLIDLMYMSWNPLRFHDEDDRRWVIGWMGCAPQKANPIIRRLIDKERVKLVEIDGKSYLTNDIFEEARQAFRGPEKAPAKADDVGQKSVELNEKSADVGENLGEVREKSGLLNPETEQNQEDAALEKKRKEENRKENISLSKTRPREDILSFMKSVSEAAGEAMASPATCPGIVVQTPLLGLLDMDDPCLESEVIDGAAFAGRWYLEKHGAGSMRNWDLCRKKALELRDDRLSPKPVKAASGAEGAMARRDWQAEKSAERSAAFGDVFGSGAEDAA